MPRQTAGMEEKKRTKNGSGSDPQLSFGFQEQTPRGGDPVEPQGTGSCEQGQTVEIGRAHV